MLTDRFYVALAELFKSGAPAFGNLYCAVGGGDPAWDRNPPLLQRDMLRLKRELARKPVTPQDLYFVDASGAASETPTPYLRVHMRFDNDEAIGTWRELGLFGQASAASDSGVLLAYRWHAPAEKTAALSLERRLRLDLTPKAGGGQEPTRYLGNSRTREVHDLDHRNPACQAEEILFDRRLFFATPEQAAELGYDRCAFCFGREQSLR
jgi:hypothetical protein